MNQPSETPENTTPPPSPPPADRSGFFTGVLAATAILALAVAITTWFISDREIRELQSEVAALTQTAQRPAGQASAPEAAAGGDSPVGQVIDVSQAPASGNPNAVVTLVEFSDYECPFCIRNFQQTMPLIEQNYIQPGKVRYVFRDFPIDANHPQSIRAHEASRCALEQGKFWQLHPHLFSPPGTHTPIALEDLAKKAGLDMTAFRACIASGRTTPEVRETVNLAVRLGATGTPWFFVGMRDLKTNTVRIVKPIGGAQPYQQFASVLDAALAQTRAD